VVGAARGRCRRWRRYGCAGAGLEAGGDAGDDALVWTGAARRSRRAVFWPSAAGPVSRGLPPRSPRSRSRTDTASRGPPGRRADPRPHPASPPGTRWSVPPRLRPRRAHPLHGLSSRRGSFAHVVRTRLVLGALGAWWLVLLIAAKTRSPRCQSRRAAVLRSVGDRRAPAPLAVLPAVRSRPTSSSPRLGRAARICDGRCGAGNRHPGAARLAAGPCSRRLAVVLRRAFRVELDRRLDTVLRA